MVKSNNKTVDSVEFHVNKSMKEFEGKIYGLSGSKLLQFCKDEFGTPLLRDNGEEYSSKSKKWILIAIRELARARYKAEAEELSQAAKDEADREAAEFAENNQREQDAVKNVVILRAGSVPEMDACGAVWTPAMEAMIGKVAEVCESTENVTTIKFNGSDTIWQVPTVILGYTDKDVDEMDIEHVTTEEKEAIAEMTGGPIEYPKNPQKVTMTSDPAGDVDTPVALRLSYTTKRNLNEQLFNMTGKMVWCNIFTSHKKMVSRVTEAFKKHGINVVNIIRIR